MLHKSLFLIFVTIAIALAQKNILHSDQPNGEPWSESSKYEKLHELHEDHYEGLTECDFFCEYVHESFHEHLYKIENGVEERERKAEEELFEDTLEIIEEWP